MVAHPAGNVQQFVDEAEMSRVRLEALSWRLVKVQEAERSALARELHDEIGQLLTGLKFLIASIPAGPSSAEQGPEMMKIVSELIGRVRDLSMDLRPPMLEEIGLIPTLQWYFERYTARTRIRVTLVQDVHRTRFADAIEIASFRIIQEALTNVARHAEVDVVEVDLRIDPDGLRIVVEDQGQGFDPGTMRDGVSAGITGMQERAHLVGGHLTLESSSGSGTRVVVVLPLLAFEEGSEDLDL
jgi:signal transduction histidine kinase